MITQERLKELLHYDPETGVFVWLVRVAKNVRAGDEAGTVQNNGRLSITICGRQYLAHRLAWLYMTGSWPDFQIDHEHGNPLDNKWSELRSATSSFNMQNQRNAQRGNRAGLLGVTEVKHGFMARIVLNNKITHIGTFKTPQDAHVAYLTTKRQLHPSCTI